MTAASRSVGAGTQARTRVRGMTEKSCETCFYQGITHCDPNSKSAKWCIEHDRKDWSPAEVEKP